MKQKDPDEAFVKKTLKEIKQVNWKNIVINTSILTESGKRDKASINNPFNTSQNAETARKQREESKKKPTVASLLSTYHRGSR